MRQHPQARHPVLVVVLGAALAACGSDATGGDAGFDAGFDGAVEAAGPDGASPRDVPSGADRPSGDAPAPRDVAMDGPSDGGTDAAMDAPPDGATRADVTADTAHDRPDVGAPDAGAPDVGVPDAGAVDPLAALGACVGTAAPLTISGQMPYLSVAVGAQRGAFLVDYGSTYSSIDLGAFAPPGPTTSGCDPTRLGVTCTVDGFAFFAAPSPVYLVTEDFRGVSGAVRQAGILGTDFTSLRAITVSYADAQMFAATGAGCGDAALRSAGLTALSSAGFFSHDLGALAAFTTVDATAAAGRQVPNVPTVPVRVAGATAVAQLDTGFNDSLVPFSVNVNAAFYSAIVAADPGALVRQGARDLSLTTCVVGVSEPVEAYAIAPGRALEFVDSAGAVARRYPDATIFVKRTPPAAHGCGGIGTWTAPAAQVAASFYVDMGTLVFDPLTSRVWVPVR